MLGCGLWAWLGAWSGFPSFLSLADHMPDFSWLLLNVSDSCCLLIFVLYNFICLVYIASTDMLLLFHTVTAVDSFSKLLSPRYKVTLQSFQEADFKDIHVTMRYSKRILTDIKVFCCLTCIFVAGLMQSHNIFNADHAVLFVQFRRLRLCSHLASFLKLPASVLHYNPME